MTSTIEFNRQPTRPSYAPVSLDDDASSEPRVLIVEYRDEVYARLKADLEQLGATVGRARRGATVLANVRRHRPDLILIGDRLPDESCLLIAAKLHLGGCTAPSWVYGFGESIRYRDCLPLVGIDRAIDFGPDLWRSSDRICRKIRSFFSEKQHFNAFRMKEIRVCRSNTPIAC